MTVSTHTQTAYGSVLTQVQGDTDGGTIAHGGNIASSRWTNKSILTLVDGRDAYGSFVVDSAAGHADTAVTGQPLGYNPSGRAYTRTLANSGFLIRGVQTLIGNKASTADILNIVGSAGNRKSIHGLETTYQHGTWADTILDLFGTGDLSGTRTNKGVVSNFINPGTAGGVTASADSAANPTRAIPGEFVILSGFTGWILGTSANNDASGGGTGSGPYMDYSAITG